MSVFLTKIKTYSTKDGYNSYILCDTQTKDVILLDPISFDLGFYQFLKSHDYWVKDVILTTRWRDIQWRKLLISIYNPQMHDYDAHIERQWISTCWGRLHVWDFSSLGGRVLGYGDCLFIGPLDILSQCGGHAKEQVWTQILSTFTQESYLFSCYGPPDTLSSLLMQKSYTNSAAKISI
ncbi:MAG: hypothetical protein ACRCVN_01060 [Spirochaetia bacterium]